MKCQWVGSKTFEGGTLVAYSWNIGAGMREISGKHLRESTHLWKQQKLQYGVLHIQVVTREDSHRSLGAGSLVLSQWWQGDGVVPGKAQRHRSRMESRRRIPATGGQPAGTPLPACCSPLTPPWSRGALDRHGETHGERQLSHPLWLLQWILSRWFSPTISCDSGQ